MGDFQHTRMGRLFRRVMASPTAARMAKGASWSLVGATVGRGASLIGAVVVARLLGRSGFGQFGMIQSTLALFGAFAGLGIGLTATTLVATFRKTDPERAERVISLSYWASIAAGVVASALLLALSGRIASGGLHQPGLRLGLQVGAFSVALTALGGAQVGVLGGLEAFRPAALLSLATGLFSMAFTAIGSYLFGVVGGIAGLTLAAATASLLGHRAVCAALGLKPRLSLREGLRERWLLLHFALPTAMSGLLIGPATWVCNAMLASEPDGYAELGLFNAARQLQAVVLFFPDATGRIAIPVLAALIAEKSRAARRLFVLNVGWNGLLAGLPAIVILAAPETIMRLFGGEFLGGSEVLSLLVTAGFLIAVNNAVAYGIICNGRMWVDLGLRALFALAVVVFAILLIPNGGARGYALAMVAAHTVHGLGQLVALGLMRSTTKGALG